MYGFIHTEWGHAQAKYYKHEREKFEILHPGEKYWKTAYSWAMKLIEFQWAQAKILWNQRCKEVHDPDGEEANNRKREEIEKKV